MKKLLFPLVSLIFTCMSLTSCLNDENESTACVVYFGSVDSINYSAPADTVWSKNISEALTELKITYTAFEEKDTITYGVQSYAIANCNLKAGNTFNEKLKTVSLSSLKNQIFKSHSDSLYNLGYPTAESIPLQKFTLHTSLWSLYTGSMVCYYENLIE